MDMNNSHNNMLGGCGCNKRPNTSLGGCHGNCDTLRRQLTCVCFALDETILYLDVYPDNQEALCHYHTLLAEKNKLLAEYEAACAPVTAYGNTSHTSWDWIKSPWPWKYEANI